MDTISYVLLHVLDVYYTKQKEKKCNNNLEYIIENETQKVKSYLFLITTASYMIFKYNYVIFELDCLDIVF